jgi:predicted lactoylglutathione lyase
MCLALWDLGGIMKAKIDFLTLAVTDLNKSITFYRDGLGMPTDGVKEGSSDHCLFELERGFSLVLYQRETFLGFTDNPGQQEKSAGFIISYFAESNEEVDEILKAALDAGGRQVGNAKEEPWGYTANFTDPDGHQWDITHIS